MKGGPNNKSECLIEPSRNLQQRIDLTTSHYKDEATPTPLDPVVEAVGELFASAFCPVGIEEDDRELLLAVAFDRFHQRPVGFVPLCLQLNVGRPEPLLVHVARLLDPSLASRPSNDPDGYSHQAQTST